MKDTCIVTGGSGFIGSNLCERLLTAGYRVVCLDNLSTGRIQNIDSFKNLPDFLFLNIDLVKPYTKQCELELEKAKYVFHLASPASPNKKSPISYFAKPIETLLVNSYGTYKLLETVKKSGAKFLFASTSEIYGDPLVHPQTESYWGNVNSTGERSCYDEAKRFGEAVTFAFIRKYDIDARVIRIFNTYGPKMHREDGRAVIEFIDKALNNKPLPVFGDGKQTRSFCYVSDLVEGIYKAMFTLGTKSEVINLGNPDEITVLDIAKTIKRLTNSSSDFAFEDLPSDDPKRRKPDISKAKRILKWEPKVLLEDGLVETIKYFKNYPQ